LCNARIGFPQEGQRLKNQMLSGFSKAGTPAKLGMYAARSAGHAKAVHAAEAVHAARAVHATKTTHLGGQRHWRGKNRRHDSTSDLNFAEHDNPSECHNFPRAIQ
jgi:hypothetical protein